MTGDELRELARQVSVGAISPDALVEAISAAPFEALGHATIDHHRAIRQGYPEVVFGEGKSTSQVVTIAEHLAQRSSAFLVTRANAEVRAALRTRFPSARVNESARTVSLGESPARSQGALFVLTAGTSDLPVADEAAEVALAFGHQAERLTDVGVAGIHRLLTKTSRLREAKVIIVVAGMDGALPSVVGGLVACPVIAVPTSVGYGAAFGGLAPLLTMLNSCAAGVTVVNIDNGFGAAVAAHRILSA